MAQQQKKQAEDPGKKIVEIAKRRFQLAADAEAKIRAEALEDLRFRAGEQWPEGIKRQREMDGRPCLTINQIPQFIRQVTNDQRQNRPAIQVNPVGDGADEETAEILQGIIRHIEYDSGADSAYDTAFQSGVTGGFGYFRILTEYEDPTSFDQVIKIKRIRNPFTVYLDPDAKEPDRSDARFGFVISTYTKEEYREQYPDSELGTTASWQSIGDGDDWVSEDSVRVVEYFWKESAKKTICLLSDKSVVAKDLLPEKLPDGITVLKERDTTVDTVQWAKLNGVEVLEQTDWAGRWIPLIPVLGDELDIDGELTLEGLVRNAKEPQQQYNFMASAGTEAIALAPKAPYVAAEGQVEGHEREWQQANVKNIAVLKYKPMSLGGTPLPPPQRNTIEPAIQATTMAMMQASQDLKNVTGIYQAALGQESNEKSGKAILARQQQSNGSNFHLVDNLTRALRHAGRIILDLIPKIYDTPRVLRIIREDGSQSTVAVNTQPEDAAAAQAVKRLYDLTSGKYDVTVSTGPSYQTKRQEAVASILQLVQSFPPIMQMCGDILVGQMDWPQATKISERLRKALPPQFQEDDKGQQLPPQVQQTLSQLTQQNQALTQHLNSAVGEIETRQGLKKMELESKERVAFVQADLEREKLKLEWAKLQVSIVDSELTAKTAEAQSQADREMEVLTQQMGQAHEYAMQQSQAETQQQLAEAQGQQQDQQQE